MQRLDEKKREANEASDSKDSLDTTILNIQTDQRVIEIKSAPWRKKCSQFGAIIPFASSISIIITFIVKYISLNHQRENQSRCPTTNFNDFCNEETLPHSDPPQYNQTQNCNPTTIVNYCEAQRSVEQSNTALITLGVFLFLSLLLWAYIKASKKCDRALFPQFISPLNNDEKNHLQQTLLDTKDISFAMNIETHLPDTISPQNLSFVSMELDRLAVVIPEKRKRQLNEAKAMKNAIKAFGIFSDEKSSLQNNLSNIIKEYIVTRYSIQPREL